LLNAIEGLHVRVVGVVENDEDAFVVVVVVTAWQ
jgi:hypothetical protein